MGSTLTIRRFWKPGLSIIVLLTLLLSLLVFLPVSKHASAAGVVPVGSGSYTTTLPAGASGPAGTIYKTANVPAGAFPTNDWWTSAAWDQYSNVMFPHPLGIKAAANGLQMDYPNETAGADGYFTTFPNPGDVTLGSTASTTYPDTRVDAYSDWTVSLLWNNGSSSIRMTTGHGIPYIYATYSGGNPRITFNGTPTVWSGNAGTSTLGVHINTSDYALFCPSGGTWAGIGSATLTCNLPSGKNYFSMAVLPSQAALATFQQYAFSFVTSTAVNYNVSGSSVSTTYNVTTQAKEGTQTGTIMGLYPHQWKNTTASFLTDTYHTTRGTMKLMTGTSFTTNMAYHGILPYMPGIGDYNSATVTNELNAVALTGGSDTYGKGKAYGRIANIMPVAQQVGDTGAFNNYSTWLQNQLQDNFTATDSSGAVKSTNLFYYDSTWGTLIGYPAGYGSDTSINDHHFHYGYWVKAAAEIARNNPGWVNNWGPMVNLLIKDFANWDKTDTRFPWLRNFDPYAGHSWADGKSDFADGNDQESSSEAINAWTGLILWGAATNNPTIENLGIYLYTTETTAVNQYWFNIDNTNFPAGYGHNYASMIWGGKAVYATWFTADKQMIRGINMLPVTSGSFYLGYKPSYSQANLQQLQTEFGSNNWTSWPDILWEYQALYDAPGALSLYNAHPGYAQEGGETQAHTETWLHDFNILGQINTGVTANIPLYEVFNKNGVIRHVAYNPSSVAITVNFSDGVSFSIPAGKMSVDNNTAYSAGGSGVGTNPTPTNTVAGGPTATPTKISTPTATTTGGGIGSNILYVLNGGTLSKTAGTGPTSNTIASAGGANHDGVPTNATIYTISGITGTYNAGATAFNLYVDAGTNAGDGIQVEVQYDFTGTGTWGRTEIYSYFATDPVVGWELYNQTKGLKSSTGAFSNMSNGKVRIQVWNAIGNTTTSVRVSATSADGQQSEVTVPYK